MSKYYSSAHATFFEAALVKPSLPLTILEWLAEDLPSLASMIPHSHGNILIKSSLEWLEIRHYAYEEELPDWCFRCGVILGYLPGGQVRDGCPGCYKDIDPNRDGELTQLHQIFWTVADATNNKYPPEFTKYLLCCHIKARKGYIPLIPWNPNPGPSSYSLMDKFR